MLLQLNSLADIVVAAPVTTYLNHEDASSELDRDDLAEDIEFKLEAGRYIDIDMEEPGGLVLLGTTHSDDKNIHIEDSQLFVDDVLVCTDITRLKEHAVFQRSVEGSSWFANVDIGVPMTSKEADRFEVEFAVHRREAHKREAEEAVGSEEIWAEWEWRDEMEESLMGDDGNAEDTDATHDNSSEFLQNNRNSPLP